MSARQVRRMLADLDPELATPADRMRPLGDGRYELKALIDADCHQGLEQLRGLLSHVDPRMTIGQLVGRVVQEALDRHDPSRPARRARTGSRSAEGDSKPAPASKDQAAPEPGHAVTAPDAATHCRTNAGPRRHSDGEAARFGPRDPGGGEATDLAARRRLLQLRRSRDWTPLQLTTSDRDRPHPAVCAGRRRRSWEPQIALPSPSPPSARTAWLNAPSGNSVSPRTGLIGRVEREGY